MKNIIIVILVLVLVGGAIWVLSTRIQEEPVMPGEEITSFEECVAAGYAVLESYPRQCKTPDGKTFIEEIELEDETAGWQTYRNEEYEFEFKYPKEWYNYEVQGAEIISTFPKSDFEKYEWTIWETPHFFIAFGVEDEKLEDVFSILEEFEDQKILYKEELAIEGIRGYKAIFETSIEEKGKGSKGINYFLATKNDKTVWFTGPLKDPDVTTHLNYVDQVLSTFRFIEGNKITKEQTCINSGGTVEQGMCCLAVSDFPNLCLIGACGCSPENSHEVKICDCGEGRCFDGNTCVAIR